MRDFLRLDWVMLVAVFLLLIVGLVALYSISLNDQAGLANFKRQIVSVSLGLMLLFFLTFFDYRTLSAFSTKFYFATLILLFLVILFGTTVRGTTGWLGLGFFRIQPVEIAKLVLIIFLASFLSKKKTQLSIAVRIIASVILMFIPVFLILKQPDFGSAAIIIGVWAIMLFISGLNKKNLFIMTLVGILFLGSGWFLLQGYQKERIENFVDPSRDPRGSGYNVIQSMVAVGSGGIFGKGLGHGSQSQLNFLPEKHTDFIFAAIAEEMGFFGAAIVFVLFSVLFYRMKEVAKYSKDNFGYMLAVGIMVMFFLQVLVNIGMNIGIMPVTGVPLPLLSYGGSSMVVILASLGILQGIYIRRVRTID